MDKIQRSEKEWRDLLSVEQYRVTRENGTEAAWSHNLNDERRKGKFACVGCGAALFLSDAKYDSGSGWPSFFQPASEHALEEHKDNSLLMRRTEVRCATCDAHLGHVFKDGPQPTGNRYCMNGTALSFKSDE